VAPQRPQKPQRKRDDRRSAAQRSGPPVAEFGSVRAQNLFAVERYPTLWQMTSTVTGDLRPEVGFQQIFRALFPCGSITGAPKVRAMQLLAQIEPQPRGVYTGAIGFFSREQTVFNVAIRTLQLDGERGTMGIGSGIVIDSVPAEEYRECLLKAEFLTRHHRAFFANRIHALAGRFSAPRSAPRPPGRFSRLFRISL
jgi:anthranilate/para-aminobenzoate synthase component I